jgi:hypothetical protein
MKVGVWRGQRASEVDRAEMGDARGRDCWRSLRRDHEGHSSWQGPPARTDARSLSANARAIALRRPSGRITDILNGKRGVSAEMALRLARYPGNSNLSRSMLFTSWRSALPCPPNSGLVASD